jgi:oligopeptide/dipeptide ABC transporter ATP-binding protein
MYIDCTEDLGKVWHCRYDFWVTALLLIRELVVELATPMGWVRPVNGVSLGIEAGESVGLVGESGSGKTMLSLALMGLLPPGARVSGEIWLDATTGKKEKDNAEAQSTQRRAEAKASAASGPRNLMGQNEQEWRAVRGREIAMIFQEPMTSLNPVMRVEAQVAEAIRAHEPRIAEKALRARMLAALEQASVPEPEVRARQFPHQLSGGLRQRVMIAMALAGRPKVLIADEPTTALDVTVQKQILQLLDELRREMGLGLLFITHDLGVVARIADRVAVMYAGRIIEQGPTGQVLRAPLHPYTRGLLAASPKLERGKLVPIPGTVPQLTALPPGCSFAARCAFHREECDARVPEFRPANARHAARCVLV